MATSDVLVPRLLRLAEVARLTGLARWRLYDLIKRGEGPPHMKVGRTIRVSERALVMWIEARHSRTGTET
jgi:excisionase family DNA binding protein